MGLAVRYPTTSPQAHTTAMAAIAGISAHNRAAG